jgi:TolB-like protein/cytochrome c-type biogenesis protein CcmH/NrfG
LSVFNELKRRNVFRVGIAYVVMAWLVMQVADVILNNVEAPGWVFHVILLLLGIGLPFAVFFAWAFELTPEGLKRESEVDRSQSITHKTGHKLNYATIGVLIIALGYFSYDKFVLDASRDAVMVESAARAATEIAGAQQAESAKSDLSIAVLPFVNMSSDQEQEYFSDGLSEELLNLLAQVPDLRVIARTSSFAYKGTNTKIADVARELGVAHVLEGSVRKAGNQLRVTAQLIRATDSSHLWSETYDRSLDNIFVIQDDIASAVVSKLKVTLLGGAPKIQETDPEAYALYLRARALSRQNSTSSLTESNNLYHRVLAIDPRNAPAWDGLATNFNQQGTSVTGTEGIEESFEFAREAAHKALAIDPDFASAHANLGINVMFSNGKPADAAQHLKRALELEPGNADILRAGVNFYRILGRIDPALALSKYVVKLDPANANNYYTLGLMNRYAGNLDAAIEAFETCLSLSPGRATAQYGIADALIAINEPDAALAAIEFEESALWRRMALPFIYHAQGKTAEAEAALADLIANNAHDSAYNIAYNLAFLGNADGAFAWLGKAVEINDPGLQDIPLEPMFANVHADSRWLPFLESIGKSPAQLSAVEFNVTLPE